MYALIFSDDEIKFICTITTHFTVQNVNSLIIWNDCYCIILQSLSEMCNRNEVFENHLAVNVCYPGYLN